MTSSQTADQIRTHIAELSDRNKVENVELARDRASGRTRNYVNDFCDEIVKPEHVKEPEDGVSHCPQRCVIAQALEHLPGENRQQEKEQHRHLKVVGLAGTDLRKIIEAAAQHDGAADHCRHFKIWQTLVIEHAIKLQEREQA